MKIIKQDVLRHCLIAVLVMHLLLTASANNSSRKNKTDRRYGTSWTRIGKRTIDNHVFAENVSSLIRNLLKLDDEYNFENEKEGK
jgi:hypothetical protein